MAKQKKKTPSAGRNGIENQAQGPDGLEERIVAFAEQLGWLVGTVEAKADGWMERNALAARVTSIRDSAADLLQRLAGSSETAAPAAARQPNRPSAVRTHTRGRSGGVVDAPGKKHRTPLPQDPDVLRADHASPKTRKPKVQAMRARRKG